jgi:hypothetical protein
MIIALEGVAATGKTTTALHLVESVGATRIPEVNLLFPERPRPEPDDWYCARQFDRWALARQTSSDLAILDGDHCHPIWFCWIYPDRGFRPWSEHLECFEARKDAISFPAFYVYLYIEEEERYEREKGREIARGHDEARMQIKYKRYQDMLGPQRAYFSALNQEFESSVAFFAATDVAAVSEKILAHESSGFPESERVFDFLRTWLSEHDPDEFR